MSGKSLLLIICFTMATSGCTQAPSPAEAGDNTVGPTFPALLAIRSEYWHSASVMVRLVPGSLDQAPNSCILLLHGAAHDNATCTPYLEPEETSGAPWYLEAWFEPPNEHPRPQGIGDLSVDALGPGQALLGPWYGDLSWYYHEDYSGVMQ